MTKQELQTLVLELWWFIENVTPGETSDGTDRFFALRERVRCIHKGKN